jgi:hypothetical protein
MPVVFAVDRVARTSCADAGVRRIGPSREHLDRRRSQEGAARPTGSESENRWPDRLASTERSGDPTTLRTDSLGSMGSPSPRSLHRRRPALGPLPTVGGFTTRQIWKGHAVPSRATHRGESSSSILALRPLRRAPRLRGARVASATPSSGGNTSNCWERTLRRDDRLNGALPCTPAYGTTFVDVQNTTP